MAAPPGKVPIFESAQAGLTFARAHLTQLAVPAAIAAAAATAIQVLAAHTLPPGPASALAAQLGQALVLTIYYAAALRLAFDRGPGPVGGLAFSADEARLFNAMSQIGFFLLIVFVVAAIPGIIITGAMFVPHQEALEAAQGDPAASMALVQKVMAQNVPTLVLLGVVYGLAWLALTSRLFLAAPATISEGRSVAFESWSWTAGNLMRIAAARLLLLIPAFFLVAFVQALAPALLGVDTRDAGSVITLARQDAARFAVIAFWGAFLSCLIYAACEAGLSAYLYKGLRPTR
jgi:hypothetical protein